MNWISWFNEVGLEDRIAVSIEPQIVRNKLITGLLDTLEADAGIDLDSIVITGEKVG